MYSEAISNILTAQGKNTPTLIQEQTYDSIKHGLSVVGLAKTGTGKTLAYSLPVLEQVRPEQNNSVIILEPTTELAVQTRNVLLPFVKALGLDIVTLVGAGNRSRQLEQLKKRKPQVLVATPGRFFDFFSANKITLSQIRHLILDEADDLLEFTKLELLSSLGQNLSEDSQILLFGATDSALTDDCEDLFARKFVRIDVRSQQQSRVLHGFLQVDNRHKIEFLQRLSKITGFKGILFFDSNESLERYSQILKHTKTKFDVLLNSANKDARKNALANLALGKTSLLLATDLAARGLDIPNLTYVVNFELPSDLNTYVHRSGRTGRMNADGNVITLGDDHDFRDLKKLLDPSFSLQRVYFKGYSLTTDAPVKKQAKVQVQAASVGTNKRKKKRKRDQKNKGYHPRKRKGE